MRFVIFATVFLLVMAGMNVYIYRRFLRVVLTTADYRAWLIPLILMLGVILFVIESAFGALPESPTLYMIVSTFVGFTFMLFVVAVAYDLTMIVSRRIPFKQERRRTLKIIFDITMLIAAASYLLRGLSQGLKPPDLVTVDVRLKDFPFEQFNIVQLTDVHVGRTIRRSFIQDLVDRINALKPDLVVLTGDLVDLAVHKIKHELEPLRDLNAPAYFILGNHEYFHGPEAAIAYLRELGIRPLLNEAVRIGADDRQFNLVGVNDVSGERFGMFPPDFNKAFASTDPSRCTIVLAHQPKSILRVDDYRCDLMLSGHTHGGQIFPFGFLVMIDQPYLAGLHYHKPDRQIYVSRGTGYWGPPLRILAPSEITRLIIKPA